MQSHIYIYKIVYIWTYCLSFVKLIVRSFLRSLWAEHQRDDFPKCFVHMGEWAKGTRRDLTVGLCWDLQIQILLGSEPIVTQRIASSGKASSTLEKQLEREALEGPTRRGVVFESWLMVVFSTCYRCHRHECSKIGKMPWSIKSMTCLQRSEIMANVASYFDVTIC